MIISFVVLYPSFGLAFQDDDWRGVVLPKTDYADGRLFTPYGIQLWFWDIWYDLLGANYQAYYITSFILRSFLSFGIIFFLYNLTRNRFASFLGGLVVAVTFSGLQTTYEVASTNVYLALLAFVILLIALLKSFNKFSLTYSALLGISLSLATLASPVRTYPLYAWIFLVDIINLLINSSKLKLRIFLLRQSIILIIFLFLYKMGIFSWFSLDIPSQKEADNLGKFISEVTLFLSSLNLSIFLNFLRGLGNIFFPSILDKNGVFTTFLGVAYIVVLLVGFVIMIKSRLQKNLLLFSFLFWPFLFYMFYFVVILGGYPNEVKGTIFLESFRRYLLPPFVGFAIFLSLILPDSFKKMTKKNGIILSSVIILLLVHAISTYTYLNELSKVRNGPYMIKIWNQIKQLVSESDLSFEKTNIFYFETDGSPRAIYTVNDGFIPHAIALYRIRQKSQVYTPSEVSSFAKLIRHTLSFDDIVSFTKNGLPNDSEPITWDRIFAFRVEGERLIDIGQDVKKRVNEAIDK